MTKVDLVSRREVRARNRESHPELMDELEAKVRGKVNNEPDALIDTSEPNIVDEGAPL